MQKFKKLLVCIFAIVCAMCIYVGCGASNANGVTGIEDGKTYIIEDGDIAATFKSGSVTLSKDGGDAVEYESGMLITEAGEYVLIWTKGENSKTYTFTVKHDVSAYPVVSGVSNGQKVEYGTKVAPSFDKGTATVAKDGGVASDFTSGTEISEIGEYVLVVTDGDVSTTVNFEITIPSYSGRMTDEFLGGGLNSAYCDAQDSILSVGEDGLLIKDVNDANGYCLFRRKFTGLDLNAYPCVAFTISELKNCSIKFVVSVEQYDGATKPFIYTYSYSAGTVYLDLKQYASEQGLDTADAELWLKVALEGSGFAAGSLSATLESIKSVSEIPAEQAVGAYIDNTAETLSLWVANTAKFTVFSGSNQALGTIVDPDNGYGKVLKRVQFNTEKYPYLIIDVEEVVGTWKIDSLSYENNLYVGTPMNIIAETSKTGKVEVNLQNLFGEDECVDVVLEFYIVGKSDEKFFTLNGLYTSEDPLYAPVISGIGEGDVYNKSVHGELKPTFDKGTATLSKDGGAAAAFASGDAITEAGEYTLTVTAGATKVTQVTFTVIEKSYGDDVIEDFLTKSKFMVDNATFNVVNNDGEYAPTFVKLTNSAMAKLSMRADFDFRTNSVLVFEVYAGDGFDVADFGFELLDDVNWYSVSCKGTDADYTEEIKGLSENVIGYKFYYKVVVAKHTSGSGATMSWAETLKTNLKLTISLEADASLQKTAVIKSLSLVNTYPDAADDDDDNVTSSVIGTLKDDFNSMDDFGVKQGGTATYDDAKDEIELTTSSESGNVTLYKNITYNFVQNGKYLVLVFETNGYTPDAGFSIVLRNEGAAGWPQLQVRFDSFTYVEKTTLASGRTQYVCYIEVKEFTSTDGNETKHDYSNETSINLVTEIVIEYGANKTAYLKCLSQTDTLPEKALPGMVETYESSDGFSVEGGTGPWGYDENKDEVFLTKADGIDTIKLRKNYTFNFKDDGKYLVLTFETNGYTPDAGFVIEILNTNVAPWEQFKVTFDNFAHVQTTTLANGRTQYVCYIEITGGTDLDEPNEFSDWTDETSITLQLDVIIQYGAEKTIYLQSLYQTTTLPTETQA